MSRTRGVVAALEIGGTHVAAAIVDLDRSSVIVTASEALDADAPAADLLDAIGRTGRVLGAPAGSRWGVAIPGPFDYRRGIAAFVGVGKFDALDGVDMGMELGRRLSASRVSFVNDAQAFLLGEYEAGAAIGHRRAMALTLGSGIGSAFLADGRIVETGPLVPPGGYLYGLDVAGEPLEEQMSRRAIRRRYSGRIGVEPLDAPDVAAIASMSRDGDEAAVDAFTGPLRLLGHVVRPWAVGFGATVVVVGGSIAASWDLVGPILEATIGDGEGGPQITIDAARARDAGLIGAARIAERSASKASSFVAGAPGSA